MPAQKNTHSVYTIQTQRTVNDWTIERLNVLNDGTMYRSLHQLFTSETENVMQWN